MRALSHACFASRWSGWRNVEGEWASLDTGVQQRVLTECATGLEAGTPTNIPDGNSFSANTLYEAHAFEHVVNSPPRTGWLEGSLIRRWLPSVIRTTLDQS